MNRRVAIYKTEDHTLLVVDAHDENERTGRYISVTAEEIAAVPRNEAVEMAYEYWLGHFADDDESTADVARRFWADLDRSEDTLPEACAKLVQEIDGDLHGFDTWGQGFTLDGEEWVFEWTSGGCQHEAIQRVTRDFDKLIACHLVRLDGEPLVSWYIERLMRPWWAELHAMGHPDHQDASNDNVQTAAELAALDLITRSDG